MYPLYFFKSQRSAAVSLSSFCRCWLFFVPLDIYDHGKYSSRTMNRIYHSLKDFQRIWIRYLSITTAKVSSINTTAKECGRYVDCLYDSFHHNKSKHPRRRKGNRSSYYGSRLLRKGLILKSTRNYSTQLHQFLISR